MSGLSGDFLGRGLAFPLQAGPGGLAEAAGVAKIEQSIRTILGTGWGERVMRPTFGCNLKSLVFAPNTDATAHLARYYVTDGLTRWEPRIQVLDVTVTNNIATDSLEILLTYRLAATGDQHSLAHSFSLEPT